MKRLVFRLAVACLAAGCVSGAALAAGRSDDARSTKEESREWRADRDGKRSSKLRDELGRATIVRPGSYLSSTFRAAPVADYARYRLRPPPRGFAWFQAGRAFLLVSLADGQVFDVVE